MPQPPTLAQATVGFAVLAASIVTLVCALLLFVGDHEEQAATFALGGGCLAVWAAVRLSNAPAD